MQRRMRHPARSRLLLRFIVLGIAFPAVYLGGASAAFYYRQRLVNESSDLLKLPRLAKPDSGTRLLVFAPHCDDETLGCAGLIQQTLAAGGHVETVIITNGDGYPAAVQRQQRVLRLQPIDYIHFAALRQTESRSAMRYLGVAADNVIFLGYPDQGLASLWNTNWNETRSYQSSFTGRDKSPYPATFNSTSTYCGSDLIRDIRSAMSQFRPTMVVVSHPSEDHPDHAAAANFVALALQQSKADSADMSWATTARLLHYLIHRGDWPIPQGSNPSLSLAPPAALTSGDTDWFTLPLTPDQIRKKAAEIGAYPSQTSIMPAFLNSFARQNELFGSIAPGSLMHVDDNAMHVDGKALDWEAIPPTIDDPARDNVLRDLQGGGDLLAVYCARSDSKLYVRIVTRCPVSTRFRYLFRLRAFGANWDSPDSGLQIDLPVHGELADGNGIMSVASGSTIEASIPWEKISDKLGSSSVRAIAVSAETFLSTVPIDRTETRLLMTDGIHRSLPVHGAASSQ